MKKHFSQLLIIIPLLFIGGVAFATYSFVGPTGAPTSNNTDGPLDISGSNQVKNGGLAVGTFQSRSGADFAQDSAFTGMIRGGTSNVGSGPTTTTVSVGSTVSDTGNILILGNYQSDSLKSGGGLKPLCADGTGTFFVCGGTAPVVPPANTFVPSTVNNSITLTPSQTFGCQTSGPSGGCTPVQTVNNYDIPVGSMGNAYATLSKALGVAFDFTIKTLPLTAGDDAAGSSTHAANGGGTIVRWINLIVTTDPIKPGGYTVNYDKYVFVTHDIENNIPCFSATDPATNNPYIVGAIPISITYHINSDPVYTNRTAIPTGQSKMCDSTNDLSQRTNFGKTPTYTINMDIVAPSSIDNRTILY